MELNKLLKKINIHPKNTQLYIDALTHSTYSNENAKTTNYQRLEFLGDAIIYKYISEYIYDKFPNYDEGQMSLLRSSTISSKGLAILSTRLNLIQYLKVGKGVDNMKSTKVLADIFESFTAAIYLDLGEKNLLNFFKKSLFSLVQENAKSNTKDPKTQLQELLQTSSRSSITYNIKMVSNTYMCKIIQDGKIYGNGVGTSKKEAEINAALDALEKTK